MKKILVLIPAFNAGKTISQLIEQISANNIEKDNILVVDDGSFDSTYEIASSCGVNVLQHKKNKGKGEALKTGFEYALREGYSGVITLDADLQHDPKFIPEFIRELVGVRQRRTSPAKRVSQRPQSDILIGTRTINLKKMPFPRWLTNNLTSIIVSILGDTKVRDSQSGYRYISAEVLKSIKLKTKKYELESELLIKAGRRKFKIDPVPISTIYEGSKSFINPLVDTGRFIKLMWKSLFW
jgi:glycosyltransferase involved in cell wall biosynthesis